MSDKKNKLNSKKFMTNSNIGNYDHKFTKQMKKYLKKIYVIIIIKNKNSNNQNITTKQNKNKKQKYRRALVKLSPI